jgi:hypothetical protein
MFFARKLEEAGCRVGRVVVNRVHPRVEAPAGEERDRPSAARARELLHWLGERDHGGMLELQALLPGRKTSAIGLLPEAPTDLASLEELGRALAGVAPVA